MEREGRVAGGPHDGEQIVCEGFGYTPTTLRVWWLPDTKEKFLLEDDVFLPYDGPVIHGTGYTF